MTAGGLRLGAPGVYPSPQRVEPAFQPVRLDIAGFVGVSLRGPVDTPVLVTSWTDYQRQFGGFESPADMDGPDRMLPYAVQAFFDQGGDRAWVVRVAPPDGHGTDATARFTLAVAGSAVEIAAANEGSWGNTLRIRLEFDVGQSFRATVDAAGNLTLPVGVSLAPHSLLRIRQPDVAAALLQFGIEVTPPTAGTRQRIAKLDAPFPAAEGTDVEVGVVTGALVVNDGDATFARQERIADLGLRSGHPRFIGAVLADESILVSPIGEWPAPLAPVDDLLRSITAAAVTDHPGVDRWDSIGYGSFFDAEYAFNDPLDEQSHRGVDVLGRVSELGLLCVPDLQWQWQGSTSEPDPAQPPPATGCFGPCLRDTPPTRYATAPAPPAQLDVQDPDQLQEIVNRQSRLVAVAELRRQFVALLDVPAALPVVGITRWRASFDSSFAAVYHPWLGVPRVGDQLGRIVPVPPSAFAAGIIAARERLLGLPWGPANELAVRAVTSTDRITDAVHDQLHLLGVNVYRAERDGFRLSAARTLSSDPAYRQLSVRRLMTMIELALGRESQWLVFEPNTADLRGLLLHTVTQFLRALYQRQAFAGKTEAQSFFVRCDDELNPSQSQALGRLIAEVGVAPAAPLEYIVLRVTQDADGSVQVSTRG
ncbi:MAG: phage tail sheath C-terminal domain-containing protein [Candidatus Dormibacteria bacterium]